MQLQRQQPIILTKIGAFHQNIDCLIFSSGSSNDTIKQGKDFNFLLISPGGTFEHTFKEARNYDYFCRLHPWMIGQLIVEPKQMQDIVQIQSCYA